MAEKESYNKPGPLIIDAQAAENWRKFIKRFEIYLIAAEKEKKADKVRAVQRGGEQKGNLPRAPGLRGPQKYNGEK